jgi:hypothetical protein
MPEVTVEKGELVVQDFLLPTSGRTALTDGRRRP